MILKSIKIRGFRSIENTQELFLEDLVTILIGANDHGKSNILVALEKLNDDKPITEEDKHWNLEGTETPFLQWTFQLTADEKKLIADLEEVVNVAEVKTSDEEKPIAEEAKAVQKVQPQEVSDQIIFSRDGVGAALVTENPASKLTDKQLQHILTLKPRVELFDPNKAVVDQVTLAQLEDVQFEFMKGIFIKAGIWDVRSQLFTQTDETDRRLIEASKQLTSVLRKEWRQGQDLEWIFAHAGTDGNVIQLRIQDPAVKKRIIKPSQRSLGFTSFFILNMTVFARTYEKEAKSFIYLFDEPGTYLHPIAQVNLQRVFESLAEKGQIVYATHSVFLVSKNVPTRNRVIRKDSGGTVIDLKPYSGNWKSVRESLGITLTHNFLISDRTLLVEGPSDPVYLASSLLYLIRSGATEIDLNDFSIADAGTNRNMVAMAKLMLEEGRQVVVLVDGDKNGDKVEKELKKIAEKELDEESLYLFKLPQNKSTEDLVPRRDLLFKATVEAAKILLEKGIRKLKDGKNQETFKEELENMDITRTEETLGTSIEKLTQTWFDDNEPISKLFIAARYENSIQEKRADQEHEVGSDLTRFVTDLAEKLKLQQRKAERKVLEKT